MPCLCCLNWDIGHPVGVLIRGRPGKTLLYSHRVMTTLTAALVRFSVEHLPLFYVDYSISYIFTSDLQTAIFKSSTEFFRLLRYTTSSETFEMLLALWDICCEGCPSRIPSAMMMQVGHLDYHLGALDVSMNRPLWRSVVPVSAILAATLIQPLPIGHISVWPIYVGTIEKWELKKASKTPALHEGSITLENKWVKNLCVSTSLFMGQCHVKVISSKMLPT